MFNAGHTNAPYNQITQEAEAGRSQVENQPKLDRETLFQTTKSNKYGFLDS